MNNYQPEDFKKCVINPLTDDLNEMYPGLKESFGANIRLIKYAIACYDPNSPLIPDFPGDLIKRKAMAAYVAGYDLDKDHKYLEGVYTGQDEEALNIIHTFLRVWVRSREWAMIVANEETFWEYNLRLKVPITKSDKGDKDEMSALQIKTKITQDQEMFHERIKRLYKEFFCGDEEMASEAEANIKFNPQGIAKKLSKQ